MKTAIGIWLAYLLLNSTGCSQTYKIENGYAYARKILSGVKPGVSLGEDGSVTAKSAKAGVQYFIYIESADLEEPLVKNIWIEGWEFLAEVEPVRDLPVIVENSFYQQKKDTLIGAGNYNVWKINVGRAVLSSDTSFSKPKQPKSQAVSIGFLYNGKLHYYSVHEIKFLEPVRLQ